MSRRRLCANIEHRDFLVPDRVDPIAGLVEGGVVDVHWHAALMDHRATFNILKREEAIAAAADGAEPLRSPDELVENALLLTVELVDAHAADPIVDFDARRALQGVDVADLADAADGELRAVGRKRQAANAADRADALHAIPGVQRRRFYDAELHSGRRVPDDNVADAIARRQMPDIIGISAHIQHRAEMRRCAFFVATKFVQLFSRGDVPDSADHIVGDAGDFRPIRRYGEMTNLPGMRVIDRAHGAAILNVPPDQPAIVAAGDRGIADDAHGGYITAMIRLFDPLDILLSRVDLMHFVVGAGDEQALGVWHARDGKQNVAAGDLTGDTEVARIGGHYARTSRIGSVPGSVSGTGRAPT